MRKRPVGGTMRSAAAVERDPQWYKDAVVYQVHVKAFHDSNGDGVGDFRGLADKLDYVRDLGATAVWLLPFYPSPLRDDGYDIADYVGVHAAYGTLADFKHFLREAHRRGLRVITELVINHTSDQHAWFQRARRAAAGSAHRNYYVWSDDTELYRDARIIFKDFETSNWTWDAVAGAYYWHRFYSHQPDLNFDNPAVMKAVIKVMDFWLEMGVDGMRLDAVPYLFERDGTSCENLPETHAALKRLRRHVDAKYGDRMLLAEANQWPEDAVAYLGEGRGDECHMAFHFPLMPRMFMALRMEDRYPILDILSQTPAIPETSQWAIFLRNHDELTLEMVTDEERDYMYRVYAHDPRARINLGIRRRLAPLLDNDRRRIELMHGLLLSLPGTPVLYYGDELGMGDNIYLGDRNGVRTPMQWSADRNAGFSRANPQQLFLPPVIDPEFSYETVNVETQHRNTHSLLWWVRRLITLRRGQRAFGRGELEFLRPHNRKVLSFVRRFESERILVVANLSRHSQYVELDLSELKGQVPVELVGGTQFPRIGELPYLLTLTPYAFHWFSIQPGDDDGWEARTPEGPLPELAVSGAWDQVLRGRPGAALHGLLPRHLRSRRWFGGKARRIKSAEIADSVPVPLGPERHAVIAFVRVEYADHDPEVYLLPLCWVAGEPAEEWGSDPGEVVARLVVDGQPGLLVSALRDGAFAAALLDAVARRRRLRGASGSLVAGRGRSFAALRGDGLLSASVLRAEQSNTSLRYGDSLILKLFRRVEEGTNPDLELGSFLTDRARFAHVAPVAGFLEYRVGDRCATVGILHGFVPNEGDAWQFTLDSVERYFERVASRLAGAGETPSSHGTLLDLADGEVDPLAHELVGVYLEAARLLGRRTAEMHLALTSRPDDEGFAAEPFTPFYQRSLYQSMRNLTEDVFDLLGRQLRTLPEDVRDAAEMVAGLRPALLKRFRAILDRRLTARRTRHHGDYHLGQVLWTGRDFVIIDFEGEPARPLSTRRLKRSPLRDVAGMVRSFHYAAHVGLARSAAKGTLGSDGQAERWAEYWFRWVASAFLRAYLKNAEGAVYLPRSRDELDGLLTVYLLEKAVYELGYELDNRPDWVRLPIQGILQSLEAR